MIDACVLIPSCDEFSDVQLPFLECFSRFWPRCRLPLYTIGTVSSWGSLPITIGADKGWSRNLLAALEIVRHEFVILWLDDMIVAAPVNVEAVEAMLCDIADNENVGAIRLGPGGETIDESVGPSKRGAVRIKQDSRYIVSTSPTIWRKEWLKRILCEVKTPWEFEIVGSEFAKNSPMQVWKWAGPGIPIEVLYTLVTRGLAEPGGSHFLKRIGVEFKPNRPWRQVDQSQQLWPDFDKP